MDFKDRCILVLEMKVASALEGLKAVDWSGGEHVSSVRFSE